VRVLVNALEMDSVINFSFSLDGLFKRKVIVPFLQIFKIDVFVAHIEWFLCVCYFTKHAFCLSPMTLSLGVLRELRLHLMRRPEVLRRPVKCI